MDYLFDFKQYGKAIAGYEKILSDIRFSRMDPRFQGRIWNNLGACFARVFQFQNAMEAFEHAYEKTEDGTILEKIYHLSKLNPGLSLKEVYRLPMTAEKKEAWEQDLISAKERAKDSKEQERIRELFARDPIKRRGCQFSGKLEAGIQRNGVTH